MNRIKQAWLALCGKLEPEVREVPVVGEAMCVSLYATPYDYETLTRTFYLSCEQAHSAKAGAIEKHSAVKIGSHYFLAWKAVPVQPKPKVAKGKRSNG